MTRITYLKLCKNLFLFQINSYLNLNLYTNTLDIHANMPINKRALESDVSKTQLNHYKTLNKIMINMLVV